MNEAERIQQHPQTRWWIAYAYACGRADQYKHAVVPHTDSVAFADIARDGGLQLADFNRLYEQMAAAERNAA